MFSLLSPRSSQLIVRLSIAAALGLSATHASAQVTLDVLKRDGYAMVPIRRPRPNNLVVAATVNGHKVNLILDTGFSGEGITFDSAYAGRWGVGTDTSSDTGTTVSGKKIGVRKGKADSVLIGNAQIKGVPLNFGLYQALREADLGYGEIHKLNSEDGFLTSGFLHACSAVIDLHNLRLYLRPPGTGRRAVLGPALSAVGLAEVSFQQVHDGNCFVDVEVNGRAGKMVIDTGAFLSSVDPRFAAAFKTTAYRGGIEFIDAAGVRTEAEKMPLSSFKIGGVSARVPDLLLSKNSIYPATGGKVIGLLGMDTLGQNWSIIDFGSQKLYFAKGQ